MLLFQKTSIIKLHMSKDEIKKVLSKIKIDSSWSFADKTRKDTAYVTHGYHRYPAKFIPQIVSRLAEKYTKKMI